MWWETVVDGLVQAHSNDTVAPVRALICDILANLTSSLFDGFMLRRQRFVLSLVLGMAADEQPIVRAAACRTLGVFVLFSGLREDLMFMTDATDVILKRTGDKSLDVRLRVFWAIANICDLFVENQTLLGALLTDELYSNITAAALSGAKDNVKARSHAVRALGSLVLAAGERVICLQARLDEIVQAVCANARSGPFKVRWNACHTLGKMFQNPHFPIGRASWTRSTLATLTEAISQTRNYKVRIHACSALRALDQRPRLGDRHNYADVVTAVVAALLSVDSMEHTVFSEYKYVEQLKEQLMACCRCLRDLASEEDRPLVAEQFANVERRLSHKLIVC
ncbi:armadillo-type protein [Thamnocephalis sphaerospora]|uniref:Armadillo-type protein n=1 Tax=Thamnocephalis sphaerospora TaxID=78915 RepID=A0A4P9XGV8_9FUNG|nr:armadillo-type protein [Thamnocephalis sphaerospora]|eukprot:RKP04867.1 armadillo-type protein [Thamnocephalis sphaerospora]